MIHHCETSSQFFSRPGLLPLFKANWSRTCSRGYCWRDCRHEGHCKVGITAAYLVWLDGYRLLVLLLIGHIARKWWWLSRNLLTKNASMFSPKWPNGSYIHTMYMLPLIISMQLPIKKIRSYVYFLLNTTYIPGFGVVNTINTISHRDIDLNLWVFK